MKIFYHILVIFFIEIFFKVFSNISESKFFIPFIETEK